MNIYGYFDESGTHTGSPALSVAGFLGRADDWGAFTFEWTDAMKNWDIPFFHMATFESRKREYANWTDQQRRERINHLLKLIDKYIIASAGVVLPLADYNAIFPEDEVPEGPNQEWLAPGIAAPRSPRPGDLVREDPDMRPGAVRRRSGGPYGIATFAVFIDVAKHVYGLSGDPFVAYTFEAGAEGTGQIQKLFADNYRDENTRRELRLDSLTFADKRQFPPLQAADLLAYELHKHLPRQLGQDDRPTRYTLRELAKSPRTWAWMNADALRDWHHVIDRGLHYSSGTWAK